MNKITEEDKKRGKRLKDLRESFGYTQIELYKKLKEACNEKNGDKIQIDDNSGKNTVSQLERGRSLSLTYANAYADVFDVSLDYLYCRKDDWKPENKTIKEQLGLTDRVINVLEDLNKNNKELCNMLNNFIEPQKNSYFIELLTALNEHFLIKKNIVLDKNIGITNYIPMYEHETIRKHENRKKNKIKPEDAEYVSLYKITEIVRKMAYEITNSEGK